MFRRLSLTTFSLLALSLMVIANLHADDRGASLNPSYALIGSMNDQISGAGVRFVMQHDCNLVAYHGSRAVWATNTNGEGTHCVAIMQGDGNLVLRRGGDGKVLWSSRTHGNPGAWLTAQWDGNVVIYRSGEAAPGRALWATKTVLPGAGYVKPSRANGQPDGCVFSRTNTKCIFPIMLCQKVWSCGYNTGSMTPKERTDGWTLCGGCIKGSF